MTPYLSGSKLDGSKPSEHDYDQSQNSKFQIQKPKFVAQPSPVKKKKRSKIFEPLTQKVVTGSKLGRTFQRDSKYNNADIKAAIYTFGKKKRSNGSKYINSRKSSSPSPLKSKMKETSRPRLLNDDAIINLSIEASLKEMENLAHSKELSQTLNNFDIKTVDASTVDGLRIDENSKDRSSSVERSTPLAAMEALYNRDESKFKVKDVQIRNTSNRNSPIRKSNSTLLKELSVMKADKRRNQVYDTLKTIFSPRNPNH